MNFYALQHGSSLECKSLPLNSPVCYCFFQDREFVEMEVPYNGAPKRPGSPSPLTSPAHSTASRGGLLQSCCGRCYPQRYQVRGRRILASITSISETAPSSSSHSHQSQPGRSHYQQAAVDPTTVPNVVFNVPGDADRQRRQGTSSSSPYNETRVWARGKDYRHNYSSHPTAESIAGNRSPGAKRIAQRDSIASIESNCRLSIGVLVFRGRWLFSVEFSAAGEWSSGLLRIFRGFTGWDVVAVYSESRVVETNGSKRDESIIYKLSLARGLNKSTFSHRKEVNRDENIDKRLQLRPDCRILIKLASSRSSQLGWSAFNHRC